MKKIKKIKININGKVKIFKNNITLFKIVKNLRIPLKKVAIELNHEIVDKKRLNKILLKNNDRIEIVHFIGGG